LARAAVTVETERIKWSDPWCLWWNNQLEAQFFLVCLFLFSFNHELYIDKNVNTPITLKTTPKNRTILQTKTSHSNNVTYIRIMPRFYHLYATLCGPGSSVDIATELRAGRSGIESLWERDFPTVQTGSGAHPASSGVKCGRGVLLTTHPPSSAAVMEEYSYIFTHPLGHTGPVTGSLYL
jgi:hypothetical protein